MRDKDQIDVVRIILEDRECNFLLQEKSKLLSRMPYYNYIYDPETKKYNPHIDARHVEVLKSIDEKIQNRIDEIEHHYKDYPNIY